MTTEPENARTEHQDYLWDFTGEPDAFTRAVELKLRPLALAVATKTTHPRRLFRVAAGVILIGALGLGVNAIWPKTNPMPAPAGFTWNVRHTAGTPTIDQKPAGSVLQIGQLLATGPGGAAVLSAAPLGEVQLHADTSLTLAEASEARHRLRLTRGTIVATINAPPRVFVVETPAGNAIDLGCLYTLSVDADGNGRLRVHQGEVEFATDARRATVPAGASCELNTTLGPGLPLFDDAGQDVVEMVRMTNAGKSLGGYAVKLSMSMRPKDALTLWHLVPRVEGDDRALIIARLAELVPLPEGTSEETAMALSDATMLAWWNAIRMEW